MDFSSLNKANAKAFFDICLVNKDRRLNDLRQVPALHDKLDYSRASLLPFWAWFREGVLSPSERVLGAIPFWFDARGACIIDGLASYWGETLTHNIPEVKWDIDPFPKSPYFCYPCVRSEFFSSHPQVLGRIFYSLVKERDSRAEKSDALIAAFDQCLFDEKDYRAACAREGKQIDPRVKKRVVFK